MNYRDLRIIANYVDRVIKRDKKQLKYEDWVYVGKDIKANKDEFKPLIAKRVVMSNLELANNKIIDALTRAGIDTDKPLKIYNEAYEIAKNKENSGDLIKIADRYTELLDMKPQKVQISETRKEIDYSNMLPEQVKRTISTSKSVDSCEFSAVNTKQDPDNEAKTNNSDDDTTL
jgi:hypothetical protein